MRGPFCGSEPKAFAKLVVIGMITPPTRAVLEGVAGAKIKSDKANAYAKRNELLPKAEIKLYAIRFPKPVLIKPRENKKAPTINQIAELAKPEMPSLIFNVPVKAATVITTMDTPPIGNG